MYSLMSFHVLNMLHVSQIIYVIEDLIYVFTFGASYDRTTFSSVWAFMCVYISTQPKSNLFFVENSFFFFTFNIYHGTHPIPPQTDLVPLDLNP